jgi:ubiquinone/menaquinone biosynthesis C-methylase UbiE
VTTLALLAMDTQIASAYNIFVKLCPPWKCWLRSVLPYIGGPRVLEVSFGTGYLLAEIAASNENYEVHGVEYNERLLEMTRQKMQTQNLTNVKLVHGTVEDLPYPNNYFDTVVVTMAFTVGGRKK